MPPTAASCPSSPPATTWRSCPAGPGGAGAGGRDRRRHRPGRRHRAAPAWSAACWLGLGVAWGLADAWRCPLVGVNHLWGTSTPPSPPSATWQPPLLALVAQRRPLRPGLDAPPRRLPDPRPHPRRRRRRGLRQGRAHARPGLSRRSRARPAARGRATPTVSRCRSPGCPGWSTASAGSKTALLYRLRDSISGRGENPHRPAAARPQRRLRAVGRGLLLDKPLGRALAPAPAARGRPICGGVAANSLLRQRAAEARPRSRARGLTIPSLILCTDNAAMIGVAAPHSPPGRPRRRRADAGLAAVRRRPPEGWQRGFGSGGSRRRAARRSSRRACTGAGAVGRAELVGGRRVGA